MLVDFKQFKTLPVETESGILLGHVNNLTLETTGLSIKQIVVNSNKLLVFGEDLLVASEQIISITSNKIVVDDSVKKILVTENAPQKLASESAGSINAETQN